MGSPVQGGDLLDRCSLEIRVPDGADLGTGVLVGPRQVLTCSHVVGEHQRVDLFEGPSSERLTGAKVELRGDPAGADDLALLELDAPLSGRGVIRFTAWTRGERFNTVGFPEHGRDHVGGHVHGLSGYSGWLQIDAEGSRRISPGFSGGAVWVPAKHASVGLVTHRDADGVVYAITAEQIRSFWPQLGDAEAATRCIAYLLRVDSKLVATGVRKAIAEADPAGAWRDAAKYPDLLAEELCLETDPDALAEGLCRAYCRLADDRDAETAEQVFRVLMEALPAALLSRWQIELPEGAATEVRLELLSRVLAEFALAAVEDGAADFHVRPDRGDSDVPRATHRVPGPGELGADPHGEEAALELAREVELRLALDVGLGPEEQREAERYLGFLATHRHTGKDPRVIDASDLRDLEHARAPEESGLILRVLNKRLARSTSGGRRLYLVAGRRDQSLVAGLRRHLPGLKIVTLEADPEQFEETEMLLDALKTIFYRRRHPGRSAP